jgi:hypothetical protein
MWDVQIGLYEWSVLLQYRLFVSGMQVLLRVIVAFTKRTNIGDRAIWHLKVGEEKSSVDA